MPLYLCIHCGLHLEDFLPTLPILHNPPLKILLAIKSKLNLDIIFSKKSFLAIFQLFSHPIYTLRAFNALLFCCTLRLPLVEHLSHCIINYLLAPLSLSSMWDRRQAQLS